MDFSRYIDNEKRDFKNSLNKSYFIYKYSSVIFIILTAVYALDGDYFDKSVAFVIPLFTIAFFMDLYFLIKILWGTVFGYIFYSIFAYFAYIEATIYAKQIIYINTHVPADVFQTSINYLAGWLLIPAWVLKTGELLSIFIFIISFIPVLLTFFSVDNFEFLSKKIELYIKVPIKEYVGKNLFFHVLCFGVGATIFNIYSSSFISGIYVKYSEKNFVKEIIREKSYYFNNGEVCNNTKEIKAKDYIKPIGDNYTSVAKTNEKGEIFFKKFICNN